MTSPATPEHEGPEHNARGLLTIGPQEISFSDVLAKLIDEAQGKLTEQHFAPNPIEQQRADRKRRLQRARDAAARNGRRVRPWEC